MRLFSQVMEGLAMAWLIAAMLLVCLAYVTVFSPLLLAEWFLGHRAPVRRRIRDRRRNL